MKLWQTLQRLFWRFGQSGVRVVIDTNVLISGTIVPHGFSAQIVDAAIAGKIRLVASPTLIEEYLDVIRRPRIAKRYREIGERADAIAFYFDTNVLLVRPSRIAPVIPQDPNDDFLIACALEGKAKYIISGDEHLLALKRYRGITILSPRAFVEQVLS
ncbi:MAG: putative toxin-antitoxin system toxin component, PIN family [Anaerolineae bacterium]|nr:putative toxin-antitoxin system toxin component, PIN family [Anaerolineae bacterium]